MRNASNTHFFATLTSGFMAVTNPFMRGRLEVLAQFMEGREFMALWEAGYFRPGDSVARNRDIWHFLDGVAERDSHKSDEGEARRLCRDLLSLHPGESIEALAARIAEYAAYFATAHPGSKDPAPLQRLKGMCREWEAECLWGYFGWNCRNVFHLRLGFYTGDLFTPEPTADRDVPPILDVLREACPDVVTVALDPEASGPDTHYKALQAVAEALRRYVEETGRRDIRVWGYRNVWFKFEPSEARLYVPVSLNMFASMESAFLNAFASQRKAPFPSPEIEGPFHELAQKRQTEQYRILKTCLGREWFHEHPSPLIRAARGFVFLHEMGTEELQEHCRSLKRVTEARG